MLMLKKSPEKQRPPASRNGFHVASLWLLVWSYCCISLVEGVLSGDEQYADIPGGRFWAFHSAGASIVDADTCEIEHSIRTDLSGRSLPEAWSRGVYMQKSKSGDSTTSSSSHEETGYIFMNSGVTTYDKDDQAFGEIIVFSTDPKRLSAVNNQKRTAHSVLSRIPVDAGWHPHSYGIYTRDEFWSQNNGKLSILSLADVEQSQKDQTLSLQLRSIDLEKEEGGDELHGELLWDESPFLAKHGFVSGRNKAIHIIDMDSKQQVGIFNYSSFVAAEECTRAYGMAYSGTNKHLYLECHWEGPMLEFNINSPTDPKFVAKHNVSGWLFEEPTKGFIVAADRGRNLLHMLMPGFPGQASSVEFQVDVPGRPDQASFLTQGPGKGVVCMPLTENVNRNNMDVSGNTACDQFFCGPPQSPEDVAAGMCLYNASDNNRTLLRAPLEDYEKVMNGEAPYLNRCPRCKQKVSYIGGDVCTCTPHCGYCASPDYDTSKTGVRCFHLEDVLEGKSNQSTLIAGAGAIEQPAPTYWDAPCSFGWTHRSSTRGGKYHVSVAHFPSNSLQIVDMSTQKLKCQVDLPGKPDHVLYVPPQPGQHNTMNGLSAESDVVIFMIVAVCVLAFVATVLVVFLTRRPSTPSQPSYSKSMTGSPSSFSSTEDASEGSALPELA